jgi:hypothetical protein
MPEERPGNEEAVRVVGSGTPGSGVGEEGCRDRVLSSELCHGGE